MLKGLGSFIHQSTIGGVISCHCTNKSLYFVAILAVIRCLFGLVLVLWELSSQNSARLGFGNQLVSLKVSLKAVRCQYICRANFLNIFMPLKCKARLFLFKHWYWHNKTNNYIMEPIDEGSINQEWVLLVSTKIWVKLNMLCFCIIGMV